MAIDSKYTTTVKGESKPVVDLDVVLSSTEDIIKNTIRQSKKEDVVFIVSFTNLTTLFSYVKMTDLVPSPGSQNMDSVDLTKPVGTLFGKSIYMRK